MRTPRREAPSDYAIHRALEALGRDIQRRDVEIEHYRRELAAERAARHDLARDLAREVAVRDDLTARLHRAERALAQYAPTVALDLTPATRPDLYAVARIGGVA